MKKTLCLVIALIIAFSALPQAVCAADGEPEFLFTLTADGKAEKEVKTGDIITVMFSLSRTDAEEPYTMNAIIGSVMFIVLALFASYSSARAPRTPSWARPRPGRVREIIG